MGCDSLRSKKFYKIQVNFRREVIPYQISQVLAELTSQ